MKKTYTTHQAFANIIQLRGVHHALGVSSSTVRTWRKLINDNPDNPKAWRISLDRMEELLTIAGMKVVQEKLWSE